MELIFAALVMAGVILVANLLALRDRETEKTVFRWLLFLINLPLLFLGLLLLLLPVDVWQQLYQDAPQQPFSGEDLKAMGPSVIFMAVWGMATSLLVIQKILARLIPIQPGSPVHTLALVLAGYLMGNTFLTLSQGGLEGVAETAAPTTLPLFAIQQILFAATGFLGVGLLVRRDGRELLKRLGLVWPTGRQLRSGVGWIIALVVLETVAAGIWYMINPEQVASVEEVSAVLLSDVDTVAEWFAFALLAGAGEEILFRGAIQPVFGIWFTAIFFAIVHVQYGFSIATLVIIILAVILGIIRQRSNTTVAIFVHAGYNFVLGLLALLGTNIDQLSP